MSVNRIVNAATLGLLYTWIPNSSFYTPLPNTNALRLELLFTTDSIESWRELLLVLQIAFYDVGLADLREKKAETCMDSQRVVYEDPVVDLTLMYEIKISANPTSTS